MRVNNWVSFICIMLAIAIGVAIAIMLSDIATVKAGWCDARPACFRNWIGVLSGWAAGAGAVLAALATIPYLKQQVEQATKQVQEAKQQTDHMLGEGPPMFDVVEHLGEPGELVAKLVNWNRRSIFIQGISFSAPEIAAKLIEIEVNGEKIEREYVEGRFSPPIPVPGWIDRTRPPSIATIQVVGTDCGNREQIDIWDENDQLCVAIKFVGEGNAQKVLGSTILFH